MDSQDAPGVELSLIVPTYNERENLIPLFENTNRSLSDLVCELIVADDDSPDGTAEVAESLTQQYPIKVVRRKNERGLAYLLVPATRKIKDPLSGFFLLKREVVEGVKLMPTGYKILLEVLVRGRAKEVAAVPYIFRERTRGGRVNSTSRSR